MRRNEPGPGQESVWDYPRPPRLEHVEVPIEVRLGDHLVARTSTAIRVLETSHPPTYYLPPSSLSDGILRGRGPGSVCEWKGTAHYWDVIAGSAVAPGAAWSYPAPSEPFAAMAGFVSFYPSKVRCTVDGTLVEPQAGGFYGGWITPDVVGPFKGEPGSEWW
ncbi:MAG: DUF427 domain-containing protein [Acidimicrobiia bacterium]|nr:DUF427 domain-containing protein [Acidimicrobiia bacterium]MDH4306168.1 DUF427 domain-containing protein [Acidimicrobiia bacterium]MDH5292086.1 DUF427 domain-containing protein [Acidimicrobiia bacterium]